MGHDGAEDGTAGRTGRASYRPGKTCVLSAHVLPPAIFIPSPLLRSPPGGDVLEPAQAEGDKPESSSQTGERYVTNIFLFFACRRKRAITCRARNSSGLGRRLLIS